MELTGIARFPVKSLVGENLTTATIEHRGVAGDRAWGVLDPDGKIGSGKSTRRFRRMPGLLELSARYETGGGAPVIGFPDGRSLRADDPGADAAMSAHVGRPVTLRREADVSHFDEGPLHLVFRESLARLGELHGRTVDPRRVRANLLVDAGAPVEDEDWVGRTIGLGTQVVLRVRRPMTRCVMVGLPQIGLPADDDLLNTVARVSALTFGLVVDVERPGVISVGDRLA